MTSATRPSSVSSPFRACLPHLHVLDHRAGFAYWNKGRKVNQFKIRNQMQRSHSKRETQCILSPIGLPLFSNRLLIRLTQDQKGLSKACNGAECKGIFTYAIPWVRGDFFLHFLTSPFPFHHTPNLGFRPKLAIH
ncbi:hypothetical protein H5410_037181 [Solanum commersonii]|uniref:Uncharacterized protein n=1 Tax=Solanum commersonii TaxID=4109 RepID=A0A9J5Y718_SOLCO|nr:hypothetical protein H5410_037181 [Solanum commersonii]